MQDTISSIPSHVPPHLVYDFDLFAPVPSGIDAQEHWMKLRRDAPDVFWTPRHGGNWVATRAVDILAIQTDHETYSHQRISIPRASAFPMYPLTLDPPEHGKYRRIIQPAFLPRALMQLEVRAREVAIAQIELLMPRGECEFIADFARVLPITVFLEMVNLPITDAPRLTAWTEVMTRSGDLAARGEALQNMTNYLGGRLAERSREPGDDLLSTVVGAEVDGRRLNGEEVMAMCLLLLFGGLDTVASMLGFIARFLALSPGHRQQLIDDPALTKNAIEELIRRHPVANTARLVRKDTVLKGAPLQAGDQIQAPNLFVGLDEAAVTNPMVVDFHREFPIFHAAFGNGPHACPGAVLARREIKIFLEEWLKRIPSFSIKPGSVPVIEAGNVNGVVKLELCWDPATTVSAASSQQ